MTIKATKYRKPNYRVVTAERVKGAQVGLLLKALFSLLFCLKWLGPAPCYLGLLSGLLRGDKSLCYCHIYCRWLNPNQSLPLRNNSSSSSRGSNSRIYSTRPIMIVGSHRYTIFIFTLCWSHDMERCHTIVCSSLSWLRDGLCRDRKFKKLFFFHPKSSIKTIPFYLLPAPHSSSSPFWTSTFRCRAYQFLQR